MGVKLPWWVCSMRVNIFSCLVHSQRCTMWVLCGFCEMGCNTTCTWLKSHKEQSYNNLAEPLVKLLTMHLMSWNLQKVAYVSSALWCNWLRWKWRTLVYLESFHLFFLSLEIHRMLFVIYTHPLIVSGRLAKWLLTPSNGAPSNHKY